MEIKEISILRGKVEIGPNLRLTYRNENNIEQIVLRGLDSQTHISRFELRTLARELEKLADRLGMDVHQ